VHLERILDNVAAVAADFADQRRERQLRRGLERTDFDRLAEAGFLLTGVPVEQGGVWESVPRSTRGVCELLRMLARADSSVALVCAMHPTVLGFWLTTPQVPEPFEAAWQEQRNRLFSTAREGAWWGTLTSEPGSGGDITRTKAIAVRLAGGTYQLSGDKQFGSGSGVTSFMMTVALPEGEETPDLFYLDVRDATWDGSTGMRLVAPWDGHGMVATQSHAFRFDAYPATRSAWRSNFVALGAATQPYLRCCFTAVCVGIVEVAISTAREQLAKRAPSLRPYDQTEWARAELEAWLVQQAFDGMLRPIESSAPDAAHATLVGKLAMRGACGIGPDARVPCHWRRHVSAVVTVWQLGRRRARARLLTSTMGTGLRPDASGSGALTHLRLV
jgi:alkylation response protein AidB-like acyl-CoA dehydrogenase